MIAPGGAALQVGDTATRLGMKNETLWEEWVAENRDGDWYEDGEEEDRDGEMMANVDFIEEVIVGLA